MSLNLIDRLYDLIDPEFAPRMAAVSGESESSILKGISVVIPFVFISLINKSESPDFCIDDIFNRFSGNSSEGLLDGVDEALPDAGGRRYHAVSDMQRTLFGRYEPTLNDEISRYAGLKSSSLSALIGLLVPFVMSFIQKQFRISGVQTDKQMLKFLNDQMEDILSAVPDEWDVQRISGFSPDAFSDDSYKNETLGMLNRKRIFWLLFLVILVILLLWLFGKDGDMAMDRMVKN